VPPGRPKALDPLGGGGARRRFGGIRVPPGRPKALDPPGGRRRSAPLRGDPSAAGPSQGTRHPWGEAALGAAFGGIRVPPGRPKALDPLGGGGAPAPLSGGSECPPGRPKALDPLGGRRALGAASGGIYDGAGQFSSRPAQAWLGSAWPLVWTLAKIIVIAVPLILGVAYLSLVERKVIGWMQVRIGPNRGRAPRPVASPSPMSSS